MSDIRTIQRAYRTALKPTRTQLRELMLFSDVTRFVYNWALGRREEHWKATGKTLSYQTLIKEFRAVRRERWPWTVGACSRCEESALKSLDLAYEHFFDIGKGKRQKPPRRGRPRKDGKPAGFPRFRSRFKGTMSFAFWGLKPEHIRRDAIRLQGIGWVRLHETDYLPTSGVKINRATVSERCGRWFISVQVEQEAPACDPMGEAVGVDVGINRLATVSDGRTYDNPRALEAGQRKLNRLQRRLARQKRGSERREDTKQRIARLHARIANVRADATHKATSDIVGTRAPEHEVPEAIGIESLNVKGMLSNHRIARAASDANMAEFLRQIAYKAQWGGVEVVAADQWYPSSKTCSRCGAVNSKLELKDRVFRCPECGVSLDRDFNAAVNLRKLAANPAESLNARGGA